ncbi:hypothetical protein MOQ06_06140 [Enterobacter sp. I4]|uniref:hypothetical protein n=1 Tax=Enterobacter sp. I4 TaxID=2926672 RepID=UPI001FF018CC|nr:hypothetical protein [Enterobacter sp. I4]MCE1523656.1 hypothetical protein [Enterobacter hormaechei]MCI2290967.1 hypothetical protein [Enterobacter sp. I4]
MGNLDNGGQAFPCDSIVERDDNGHMHGKEVSSAGMTLRDYFAAKAMQGELASGDASRYAENIASRSYAIADAMLKARE